jgi:hypothetical protein
MFLGNNAIKNWLPSRRNTGKLYCFQRFPASCGLENCVHVNLILVESYPLAVIAWFQLSLRYAQFNQQGALLHTSSLVTLIGALLLFRLVFLTKFVFHLLLEQENIKLANWVSTQRQEAKLMREGRSTRLSEKKIEKLNAIEFVWVARECCHHMNSEVYLSCVDCTSCC